MKVRLALSVVATLLVGLLTSPVQAQSESKIEKFNYSSWARGLFSEAVTVTNIGGAKLIFLAGVGAEDENGPRGNIRHKDDFKAQCQYSYEKIKQALAAQGAGFEHVVRIVAYLTDIPNQRLPYMQCMKEALGSVATPAHTMLTISRLAFPEMMVEVEVTAVR